MLSGRRIQRPRPLRHHFWSGVLAKKRPWISWRESARALVLSSCQSSFPPRLTFGSGVRLNTSPNLGLNVLLVLIPIAWVSHFKEWAHGLTFARMP